MTHFATARFWSCYAALPEAVQKLADENFELLKLNASHPSLHFKRVGAYWSARVGLHYRALAVADDDALVWFWIGHHNEYDRLIR